MALGEGDDPPTAAGRGHPGVQGDHEPRHAGQVRLQGRPPVRHRRQAWYKNVT